MSAFCLFSTIASSHKMIARSGPLLFSLQQLERIGEENESYTVMERKREKKNEKLYNVSGREMEKTSITMKEKGSELRSDWIRERL